jgi:CMP-N,N'-diacetyllegionaminic acid synthase
MKINKFLIIILARKGSLRLKDKNIKKLGTKKLIEHTIDYAKKFKNNCNIILSTDDIRIIKIAKKKNIICPWIRPAKLSTSKSTSIDAVLHCLEWYINNFERPSCVVLLQPTSPFRSVASVQKSLKKILNRNSYSIISVSPIKLLNKVTYSKNILININNNLINLKKNNFNNYKYFINGNFYLATVKFLKKYKSFFYKNKTLAYVIKSKKYSVDIDTIEDFNYAETFC